MLHSLRVESSPVKEKSASNASSKPPLVIDPHRSLNPPDEQSRIKHIQLFCEAAPGTNLEEACAYLERSNWNVNLAVSYFIDERRSTPSRKKSNPQGFSNAQSYLQNLKPVEICSSSCDSMEVDVTDSLKEARPLMASFPVKGKAVEEDSSTNTFAESSATQERITMKPRSIITITIIFADGVCGRSLPTPFRFRLNHTVKDIRDAIDELTPPNDRDYFLQSMDGVDYKDSNTTVHEISTGGSTTLRQIFFPDP